MTIALYSRKSKITESGDSVGNQIEMCREYAYKHFDDCDFIIYEDEGFSGGTTDRPMFKKLLLDIKSKKVDVLLCYRLDRISRNVADFSETLELLNENRVGFISIKEQFDTTTPMGKAMMYIASVFAQLERDTIAERISDNLYQLAKKGSGRYLNGTAPEGFIKIRLKNAEDKEYSVLKENPQEADKIRLIYQKYLELQSLNKVEVYLYQNDIKTRKNCKFTVDAVNRILRHPIYAVADEQMYRYFTERKTQFANAASEFDGRHGISVFRRSGQGKGKINQLNDFDKWVVGIGAHGGIINAGDWLRVQTILESRGDLGIKKTHGHHGLLNGLLRCKGCGGYMRPNSIRKAEDGAISFHYVCQTKEISRSQKCRCKNIRGDVLDLNVMKEIKLLLADEEEMMISLATYEKGLGVEEKDNRHKIKKINQEVKANENAIGNLLNQLSKDCDDITGQYIRNRIKELGGINKELQIQRAEIDEKNISAEIFDINEKLIKEAIERINKDVYDHTSDIVQKRNLLRLVVKNIYWDGQRIEVELNAPICGGII